MGLLNFDWGRLGQNLAGTAQGDLDWGAMGGYFQERPELTQGLLTSGVGLLAGQDALTSAGLGGQAYKSAMTTSQEKQKLLYQQMLDMAKSGLDYSKYGLDVSKYGLEEKKYAADQEFGTTQAATQLYGVIKSSNQSVKPEYMNAAIRETLLAKQQMRQPQYRVEWFEPVKSGARGLF